MPSKTQPTTELPEPKTIDVAIGRCEKIIIDHRSSINWNIAGMIVTIGLIVFYFVFLENVKATDQTKLVKQLFEDRKAQNKLLDSLIRMDSLIPDKFYYYSRLETQLEKGNMIDEPENLIQSPYLNYAVFLVTVVGFSIFAGFYRFHLKEISKAEQNLIAFNRIRIAGANSKDEYESEVRIALTEKAFYMSQYEEKSLFSKKTKIESPLPGYPASDVMTNFFNKFFENFEIKEKEK